MVSKFRDQQDILNTLIEDLEHRLNRYDQQAILEAGLIETLMTIKTNMSTLFSELEDYLSEIQKTIISVKTSLEKK